ncbi:hypothetical protein DB347_20300 [Opitutaceae bacterium EW11]|nr:hypothetical protein DB347_20300 [Opitutaceae bacterium EW11]
MIKYYNISLPDTVQRLTKNGLLDSDAVLNGSVAMRRRAPSGQEELILAHYQASGETPYMTRHESYGELHLARESTTVAALVRRLSCAVEKAGSFDLTDGLSTEIESPVSMELLPSPDGTKPAKYLIEVGAKKKGDLGGSGPLVNYGLLSYESIEQAVRAWIPLRPFHGHNDARKGNVIVEVPLAAPRIGEVMMQKNGMMRVTIDQVPRSLVPELTGVWQSGDGNQIEPFGQKVVTSSIDIVRPDWAERVALWLTLPDSLVTDWFYEDAHRCTRIHRVLFPNTREHSGDHANVLAQIHAGENEEVEFKPLLSFEPGKFDELIETVIAFANKRGGTVYLGIGNHQEIVGVEKALRELSPPEAKHSLDECARIYCAKARTKICDRVMGQFLYHIEAIQVAGLMVIRVIVEEGKNKPYADVRTKDVWTRRGANTVKPDPSELTQLVNGGKRVNGILGFE